jgi:hypothetical protein
MTPEKSLRAQLTRQLAHWNAAIVTIDDIDNFAAPEAWARVERYLNVAIRKHLTVTVAQLRSEANGLSAQLAAAETMAQLQLVSERLLAFRVRYVGVETILDFYGDAINTRSSTKLGYILRALDLIATRSMESVLRPLGREAPPVLCYIDKGLGASILKANVRLWDGGTMSPAAAIKITRHNLYRPTSLIHETGHQVAHLIGWTEEYVRALYHEFSRTAPREVVEGWAATASEIVADIHAFVHCGYAAVAALHDVVAADCASVLRYIPGDPHPIPYIRVLLNVEFCRRMYGAGPWDELAEAWCDTHPLERAAPSTRAFLEHSLPLLPRLAELSLLRPMRAFGGRAITEIIDPARVRPDALMQWSKQLGSALATSPYWANAEPIRLLALSGYQMAVYPERAKAIAEEYETWTQRIGSDVRAA